MALDLNQKFVRLVLVFDCMTVKLLTVLDAESHFLTK